MCTNFKSHRHPINCIVPPHMLEVLAMRGDEKVAKVARAELRLSEKMRDERSELMGSPMNREGTGTESSSGGNEGFIAIGDCGSAHVSNLKRKIYDGENKAGLPGKLVRGEGDAATGDEDVDRAYDYAGSVYDLYFKEFDRDSLDGLGMALKATVHHRRKYNNAFWDGEQMAYGDGDGQIFRTFIELSVVAHEMSHGVVQFSGGLAYQGQSGALNESFSDVFGAIVSQYAQEQSVDEAHWLIGKDILGPDIDGVALRSMIAPGTAYSDAVLGQDPQPFHMDFYVDTTSDNGGVHINSGIPNHAFYLYCQYMGGNSWAAPGQIWYHALQRLNNPMATFHDWASQTLDSAMTLYGIGAKEVLMLRRAWKLVGIQI